MMRITDFALCAALVLGVSANAAAQPSVFLVRHAEKADSSADPHLSEAGRSRAESLASMLKDAKITAVLVTQYRRTQQTAAPLAKALGIEAIQVHSDDIETMIQRIKAAPGNVLVVGHTGSIPKTLVALGVADPPEIAETEYDNLFIVTRGVPPGVVRLRVR